MLQVIEGMEEAEAAVVVEGYKTTVEVVVEEVEVVETLQFQHLKTESVELEIQVKPIRCPSLQPSVQIRNALF